MLAVSSSGESSWIAKNQPLGMDLVVLDDDGTSEVTLLVLLFGVYEEIVPLKAASIEKGRALDCPDVLPKLGGSIRRNGESDVRDFFDSRPTRLCFGEPRLLEMLPVVGGEVAESLRF